MVNILTLPIFQLYGGSTGSASAAQIQVAFEEAEALMASELATFLVPTTITGTYDLPPSDHRVILRHGWVRSIEGVWSIWRNCETLVEEPIGDYGFVLNDRAAVVVIRDHRPFQARIAYTAGLTTGSTTDPRFLHALVLVADMVLNQLTNPGSITPPIVEWHSLRYSERYSALWISQFGSDPRAQLAAKLIRWLKALIPGKVGW